MQKKKRASEKVKKAVVKLSRKVAEMEANTTCTFTFNNIRELEVEYKGCSIEIIVLFFVLP